MAFSPRRDVLPAAQLALWPVLRGAAELGFLLYGGTATALRLGHRTSVDFDFFSDRELDRRALEASLPFMVRTVVLRDRPDTLTVLAEAEAGEDSVKLSFSGGIGFGRVGEPDMTDDGVLQIASLDDLMATRLKVLVQRVEARDYVDIAAMIRAGVSLARGLGAATTLFGSAFQPAECLKAMTWFEGGDLDTIATDDRAALVAAAAVVRDVPTVPIRSRGLTA